MGYETEPELEGAVEQSASSPIAKSMVRAMETASWIRQMFEEGARLKREVGAERVFDFTLGNPSAPPPPEFERALIEVAAENPPGVHAYMTNTGLEETRSAIARSLSDFHGVALSSQQVVMTCGAAGGLNIFLKSVLDQGDEVMVLRPFFPEYLFYIQNHGGVPTLVDTDEDFQLDLERVARSLTERTRVVIINTPNNPTGVCYPPEQVNALGRLVDEHADRIGRPVYLVIDEPYRRIRYTDVPHPSVIRACRHGVVITSYSKELGLAGERIGFVLLNPAMPGVGQIFSALATATRILGFVNAPALMQRVLPRCIDAVVDLTEYRRNRDLLFAGLRDAGYELPAPDGAFFLFPKVPGGDDLGFCERLRQDYVLCVPGRGFGSPGYIRISYAVPTRVVEAAIPIFRRAAAEMI